MKSHSVDILILIILCNLAALAGYYFSFQNIKAQTKAASSLIGTVDMSQQKDSHLGALRAVVKDTDGKRQQLATFLLSSDTEVSFIERIETLAKGSGLGVKTKSVSSVAGSMVGAKNFQMQIETTGSWSNTMYFLSQLENLPYDIRVQGDYLSKQSGSAWLSTLDISVPENK